MEPTKLLYMEEMQKLTCQAHVEDVEQKDGKTLVYLDQTVFYPQGGGQPYDTGVIASENSKFVVEEVRFADGRVLHIGNFDGPQFMPGEDVECSVDEERRVLNTRLHSAGHVVDMAISQLGYDWVPEKGYHFPDGPYIKYAGELPEEDREGLAGKLTAKINEIIGQDIKTEIRFVDKSKMGELCRHVPEYLPEGKPARVVLYGDFGVPCGGTHVANLKDIGQVNIRKIKASGNNISVSYELV